MEFLFQYGLFLAKVATFVVAIAVVAGVIASVSQRDTSRDKGHIKVTKLNERFEKMTESLKSSILDHRTQKEEERARKKQHREEKKQLRKRARLEKKAKAGDETAEGVSLPDRKRRLYVVEFNGDMKASATNELRHALTAILSVAESKDEVFVNLESPGGVVHGYGLAASQLARVTKAGVPLTVSVDKIAASGGYMMACVADKIIAAPFAVIGSIGVVAQLPNFHRLLKKNDVDYEMLTAGEYKRTLTMFGENTDKGRAKFQDDLEDIHTLFKSFIHEHREKVNIDEVATGEIWFGRRALEKQLIDDIQTSDEYLTRAYEDADIFAVEYVHKKSLSERLGVHTANGIDRVVSNLWYRLTHRQQENL